MSKYVYPAFITEEEDAYIVKFPDLQGCYTDGQSLPEALENAKDVLCLTLYGMEVDGDEIPEATSAQSVNAESGVIVTLVCCDTADYKRFFDTRTVKKNCTIPAWLCSEAEKNGINFSRVLSDALREKLGV